MSEGSGKEVGVVSSQQYEQEVCGGGVEVEVGGMGMGQATVAISHIRTPFNVTQGEHVDEYEASRL